MRHLLYEYVPYSMIVESPLKPVSRNEFSRMADRVIYKLIYYYYSLHLQISQMGMIFTIFAQYKYHEKTGYTGSNK